MDLCFVQELVMLFLVSTMTDQEKEVYRAMINKKKGRKEE